MLVKNKVCDVMLSRNPPGFCRVRREAQSSLVGTGRWIGTPFKVYPAAS